MSAQGQEAIKPGAAAPQAAGALTEDIDGYMLVAKQHDGWDAVLALVLALDRSHRALLVRLLDRLARMGSRYLDDLEELSTVLSEGESLAEDVEAAREERVGESRTQESRSAGKHHMHGGTLHGAPRSEAPSTSQHSL